MFYLNAVLLNQYVCAAILFRVEIKISSFHSFYFYINTFGKRYKQNFADVPKSPILGKLTNL